jgi:hypothetical protein
VYAELGVLPIFELVFTHPELTVVYASQTHIAFSQFEITFFEAHRLGAVATASTLVKHEFPKSGFQL